jgi:hypothetical protein
MGLLTADLGSVPVAELVPAEVCEGVVSPLPGRRGSSGLGGVM